MAELRLSQELHLSPQNSTLHHHTAEFTSRFIYKPNAETLSPLSFTSQSPNDQSECPCTGASKWVEEEKLLSLSFSLPLAFPLYFLPVFSSLPPFLLFYLPPSPIMLILFYTVDTLTGKQRYVEGPSLDTSSGYQILESPSRILWGGRWGFQTLFICHFCLLSFLKSRDAQACDYRSCL